MHEFITIMTNQHSRCEHNQSGGGRRMGGTGARQAAAEFTAGSDWQLLASVTASFRFSDKTAFCLLESSDSCDRGEVAGWGTPVDAREEDDGHPAMEVVMDAPRRPAWGDGG